MTRIGRFRVGWAGFVAVAAMAVPYGGVQAQESWLVGTWEATAETPGMQDLTISMIWTVEAEEDGTLRGSWTGEGERQSYTREMSGISVDGDTFGFTVRLGERRQTGAFVFEGTMAEGEVSGTFELRPEGVPAAVTGTFSGVQAQESWLVGTWEGTAESTNMPGPTISMTWTIETAKDGTYTGSWTGEAQGQGEGRTYEMSDISVDGDAFGFTVSIDDQGGAGQLVFEGTMAEGEVGGTFEGGPEGMPAMITGTFSVARAEGDGA